MVEDIAAGAFDERELFHLINLAREEQAYLLLTARNSPAGWSTSLRDLAISHVFSTDERTRSGVRPRLDTPPAG